MQLATTSNKKKKKKKKGKKETRRHKCTRTKILYTYIYNEAIYIAYISTKSASRRHTIHVAPSSLPPLSLSLSGLHWKSGCITNCYCCCCWPGFWCVYMCARMCRLLRPRINYHLLWSGTNKALSLAPTTDIYIRMCELARAAKLSAVLESAKRNERIV